jgi:hypothetical protein
MLHQALLAVLILVGLVAYGADPGHATDSFTDTAKKAAAVSTGGTGTTRFYGRDGAPAGRTDTSQTTTRFYGHDGSSAGRADRSGNTIWFYGKDGAAAGRADR